MAKRATTMVKDINKMFPPENPDYPICFIRDGETQVIVSGESYANEVCEGETFGIKVVDYYGEFRGGYAWIHPKLEAYAAANGGYWEWEDPGGVVFVR